MPKCQYCGREFIPGSKYCKGCSATLPRYKGILNGEYIREDEVTKQVLEDPGYIPFLDIPLVGES